MARFDLETLMQSLPTREDIAQALGAQRSTSADVASGLGIFSLGLLVGAGAALLFAPKAGNELRRDLSERFANGGSREERAVARHDVTGQPDVEWYELRRVARRAGDAESRPLRSRSGLGRRDSRRPGP
jgi:hypothetical protein